MNENRFDVLIQVADETDDEAFNVEFVRKAKSLLSEEQFLWQYRQGVKRNG